MYNPDCYTEKKKIALYLVELSECDEKIRSDSNQKRWMLALDLQT